MQNIKKYFPIIFIIYLLKNIEIFKASYLFKDYEKYVCNKY